MEVTGVDSWLPLKELSPMSDEEDGDCSPITIVAQDYLDDPPVRDIPATPPSQPPPEPNTSLPPPPAPPSAPNLGIDVSHAIAATASAVASSIPLTQLQRSIDTFCSTLIARSESRSQEPDRYALRVIEDLDLIKHQLSLRHPPPAPPPAPAPQRDLLTEFQMEVRQLKLKLEEQSSMARIYGPLTEIQGEISSLKTALQYRNTSTPPPTSRAATPIASDKFISKECQTQHATARATPSVSIQTSPLPSTPRFRNHLPSPILSSSPLPPPLTPLHPPLGLSHLDRKLREIQKSKQQLEHRPSRPTHSLPLSDIVQQVLNRERDDVTSRAHQLVSDKLQSIKPAPPAATSDEKPGKRRPYRNQAKAKTEYKHEKDPVYASRVYGRKPIQTEKRDKNSKTVQPAVSSNSTSSHGDIGRVYKQIEKIQLHLEQLATTRQADTLIPPPPAAATIVPPPTRTVVPNDMISQSLAPSRTARLMRPPRLIPSPHPPPPADIPVTSPHFITYDNAQVQTSFLSPIVDNIHSSPHKLQEPTHKTSHTQTDIETTAMVIETGDISHISTTRSISTSEDANSHLFEQMISLQAEAHPGGDPSPLPTPPLDPQEVLREQELGRRHLLERVQQMLVEKAAQSVSDQARLSEARRRGEEERRVSAAVESALKREVLSCIRTVRQELEKREEPLSLQPEPEEVYSMSFASETDEPSSPSSPLPCPEMFPPDVHSTPYSPTFSIPAPLPLSASPSFPPSPHTRAFLQRSPPLYRAPSPVHTGVQCNIGENTLQPEEIQSNGTSSPISEEIQCDLNKTLTKLPPSPLPISPHLNPLSTSNTPVLSPLNHSIQCDMHRTPTPISHVHAEIQCDLRQVTPILPPSTPPFPTSTPAPQRHTGVQCDLREVTPLLRPAAPDTSSTLPSYTTDYTPSSHLTDTDYPSYVSEGEYVPPRGRYKHRTPSSGISEGEVPPGHQLSPAVEATLIHQGFPSDTQSSGEYIPPQQNPVQSFHQSEGIFSSGGSSSPHTPVPAPNVGVSPGEAVGADLSDSDHLSRSITLSIAFSSPSNKTTTRHRDGVDVFDVSALEGLTVPAGWELSQMSQDVSGDKPLPNPETHTPADTQPNRLELDRSSNSTSCDIHSLSSLSKETP